MTIWLSMYLAIGFLLSHLLHVHAYRSQGATELATWLILLSPVFTRSIRSSLLLAGCLALTALGSGIVVQRKFDHHQVSRGLRLIAIVFTFLLVVSQTISSSVLRVLYESGIVFVFTTAVIVDKIFIVPAKRDSSNKEMYERLWDLLRLSIPMVLGFSAIFGGVGAISSFYDTPQAFIHLQMYRHLCLTVYFAMGMMLFVMWPIFRHLLTMHCKIYAGSENIEEPNISNSTSSKSARKSKRGNKHRKKAKRQ
ncbi:MAG: hypothetical protein WBC05_03750 [Sedimentisphaerales bacterium]